MVSCDAPVSKNQTESIQVLAAAGIVRTENARSLNFNPQGTVNRAVIVVALVNVLGLELITPATPTFKDVLPEHFAFSSIETLFAQGVIRGIGRQRFGAELTATREQLAIMLGRTVSVAQETLFTDLPINRQPLQRRELSRVLYRVLKQKA